MEESGQGQGISFDVSVDQLTDSQVDREIATIRSDPKSPYWKPEGDLIGGDPLARQYKERMGQLYARKHGAGEQERQAVHQDHRGLHDLLRKEGYLTSDEIEQKGAEFRQAIENDKIEKAKQDALGLLRSEFGEETDQKIAYAHYAVDRFLKQSLTEDDWKALDSEMGNDPTFIKKISDVIEYLDSKYWNGQARSYRRKG